MSNMGHFCMGNIDYECSMNPVCVSNGPVCNTAHEERLRRRADDVKARIRMCVIIGGGGGAYYAWIGGVTPFRKVLAVHFREIDDGPASFSRIGRDEENATRYSRLIRPAPLSRRPERALSLREPVRDEKILEAMVDSSIAGSGS